MSFSPCGPSNMTASWHEFAVTFFWNDRYYIRTEVSGIAVPNRHTAAHAHTPAYTHISKCSSWLVGTVVSAILLGQDGYQYVTFLIARFIIFGLIWRTERACELRSDFVILNIASVLSGVAFSF